MSMSPQKIAKEIMDFCFVTSFILLEFKLLSLFHSIQFFLSIFAGISFNCWKKIVLPCALSVISVFFLMEPRICELQNENSLGREINYRFLQYRIYPGWGLFPCRCLTRLLCLRKYVPVFLRRWSFKLSFQKS